MSIVPIWWLVKVWNWGTLFPQILLNLITDVFSKMLEKAASAHLIRGLLPQAVPGGVIGLQYADDIIQGKERLY